MGDELVIIDGDVAATSDGVAFVETARVGEAPAPVRRWWRFWPGWRVVAGVTVLAMTGLAAWLAVEAVREARKLACQAQLKEIGLAFQAYHERHGSFPPPAVVDRAGKPLLSWRVALLPHLGYQSLHDRFHRDEPWDSPHNLALVAEMPPVFACPSGTHASEGRTSYLVVVGPRTELGSVNTLFEPGRGADMREVLDGTSNSVMTMEADHHVVWTRPDAELTWTGRGVALPRLDGPHRRVSESPEVSTHGTHVLFADGSVKFVRQSVEPNIVQALLTINGNEVVSGSGEG